LLKLLLVLAKIVIITLGFEKNAFFRRKLAKIAENCDHNFDPRPPGLFELKKSFILYLWLASWLLHTPQTEKPGFKPQG
jgi:hypothetical protein